jgi:hypothetical protein
MSYMLMEATPIFDEDELKWYCPYCDKFNAHAALTVHLHMIKCNKKKDNFVYQTQN